MSKPTTDPLLSLSILSASSRPQRLIWLAAHTCYSPIPDLHCPHTEAQAGLAVVKHLLKGGKGHYSPLEQAHMSLHIAYLPHDTMQQLTRHRLLSFSVQSFRYTSEQFLQYKAGDQEELHKLVYIREPGLYVGRGGNSYYYTAEDATRDEKAAQFSILAYQQAVDRGAAPEHARGLLPFNVRQNLVAGGNLRAWLHVLDLRLKADAQPEIQQLSNAVLGKLQAWCPQIIEWYIANRASKALLAP